MSSRVLTAAVGATLLAACCSRPAVAEAPALRIFSSVDGGRATPDWKYVRLGQRVLLEARGRPSAPPAAIRWFHLEPSPVPLDNTQPSFHFEAVEYQAVELPACRGALTCPADVRATDPGLWGGIDGVGTMAFQVEVTLRDGTIRRSPGTEARDQGGLSRSVHRVTVRRDDSYLGMLTELFQTPYIFGSDGPAGHHEAELLIGSDCADLAVYGARRLGAHVPFVSTWTLERYAPKVALASADREGLAIDKAGQPLAIGEKGIRPGDLLLFPSTRHVAVLYEDRPPEGLLDSSDLILHTCWAPPRIEALGATGCASYPIRVLRFPQEAAAARLR